MAAKPVDDDGLILYILGGLGLDYGPFVTSITTRDAPTRLLDFHGLLLSEEIWVSWSQTDLQNIVDNVAAKEINNLSSSNWGKIDSRKHKWLSLGSPTMEAGPVIVAVDYLITDQMISLETLLISLPV